MTDASDHDHLYCQRGAMGEIVALAKADHRITDTDSGWERIQSTQQEVSDFLRSVRSDAVVFEESDIGLIRVLEDLVDILIQKRVLSLTDFPQAAQVKLLERFIERTDHNEQIELRLDS